MIRAPAIVCLVVLLAVRAASSGAWREQGVAMTGGGDLDVGIVERVLTQAGVAGAIAAVLLVVLWSYRRDFMRQAEDKDRDVQERKTEKERLEDVLRESTAAITNSAVATARQTDATHRLARTVESLEKRLP